MTFAPGSVKPPTSGRRRGTPNRETAALEALIKKLGGMDPVEVMARAASGDAVGLGLIEAGSPRWASTEALPVSLRIKAAAELCSYLLPKRKAVEITSVDDRPGGVLLIPTVGSLEEWQRLVNQSHAPGGCSKASDVGQD